jgi:hypothetical protein
MFSASLRKILRIITYALLVVANLLLLGGILLWYLAETGRINVVGLEPITVFIGAIIAYLGSFLGFLVSKEKPEQVPNNTIKIGGNSKTGDIFMGDKTVNIQGDNVQGDKFTGDKVMGDKHEHIYPTKPVSSTMIRPARAVHFTNRET